MNAEDKRKIVYHFNNISKNVTIDGIDSNDTVYGVNWSALGTVDEREAIKFMIVLKEAIELCKFLNSKVIE